MALVVVGLAARGALAADRPPVYLDVDPCIDADPAAVRHHAAIELGGPLAAAPSPELTRVTARCEPPLVLLSVDDPLTGKVLARRIDLRINPASARARLLAIAATELVLASWFELEARPAAAPAVVAAPPPPRAVEDAAAIARRARVEPAPRRLSFGAVAALRLYNGPSVSFGGGVAARLRLRRPWVASADLVLETQSSQTILGDTRTLRATLAPRFGARLALAGLELEGAAGFRLGAAHMSGSADPQEPLPVQARSFTAPWGGPTLVASAHAGRAVVFGFVAELGLTVFSVEGRVDGETTTRLAGPWLLLSVIAGTSF